MIRIEIGGKPEAKGRGRVGKLADGRATVFTPAHTRKYETRIRDAAYEAMAGRQPEEGPVAVCVAVLLPIPKSASNKNAERMIKGLVHPCTKPDIDNYVKSALDGINNIVVKDDNQVVNLVAHKLYANTPRMVITVQPMLNISIEEML